MPVPEIQPVGPSSGSSNAVPEFLDVLAQRFPETSFVQSSPTVSPLSAAFVERAKKLVETIQWDNEQTLLRMLARENEPIAPEEESVREEILDLNALGRFIRSGESSATQSNLAPENVWQLLQP